MAESINDVIRRGFKRNTASSAGEEPEKRARDVFEMDVPQLLEEMKTALSRLEEVQSELGIRLEEASASSAGEEERRG